MILKARIIVDSTTDLIPEYQSRVEVVPLTVYFGLEEFSQSNDKKKFYEKLIESDVLPTTSQATPAAFMKEFQKIKEAGEEALVITLSAKLSGTYQSAMIAAQEFGNIYIVDSDSAAIGSGILVERAFQLLDNGMSAKEFLMPCY